MKRGQWEKKKFLGEELRDKTLGLAGLGRIGQEVARRAQAFDMRIIAHDPFISEQVAAGLGVRARLARRPVRRVPTICRCTCRRRRRRGIWSTPPRLATREAGHPHHQHGARRPGRRSRAGRRHRSGPRRRRRARRLSEGTDRRSPAADAAAGHRDAAHRRVDARRPGTGRRRNGHGAARLPQGRHHPQRGQLAVGLAGGVLAPAPVPGAGRAARHVHRADERPSRAHRSACAITASSPRAAPTCCSTPCSSGCSSRSSRPPSRW